MPEIAAAHRAAQRASEAPGRRLDQVFAGGIALVAIVGLLVYPYANADEARQATRNNDRSAARTAVVAVPTLATVRESSVSAPSLAEAPPGPETQRDVKPTAAPVARVADTGQRSTSRPASALTVPVTFAMPARDPVVTGDGQSVDLPSPPAAAPPAPADPWQILGDALRACARSSGVWERATCEQSARLAHCDGYWGSVALCPSGRTEFGQ